MGGRFNTILRAALLAGRWAMAPLCFGLIAALAIVVVQFGRELVHAVTGFPAMRGAEVILSVLKLVDLVLIANLLLMIVGAGIEIFLPAAPAANAVDAERPEAAGVNEFAALKPKLFASIGAIAAIDLLESFVNIESVDKTAVLWEIVILLAFVVSGVLLAWMDRLADRH
jgi:uncharacterized protein (TIGR00645 family)